MIPLAALRGPALAELGVGPAATALRAFLATPEAGSLGLPPSGWWTVARTERAETFMSRGADGWAIATMALGPEGWEFAEGGRCSLHVRLAAGFSFATWRLDPAHRPARNDLALTVLATETACASGNAPTGRMLPPTVVETDAAVTISLVVRSRPGAQDCPGNPEVPVNVPLAAPVGDRALLDGSAVPPAPR